MVFTAVVEVKFVKIGAEVLHLKTAEEGRRNSTISPIALSCANCSVFFQNVVQMDSYLHFLWAVVFTEVVQVNFVKIRVAVLQEILFE